MFGASVDGIPDNMIMSLSGFSQMGGGSSSLFLLPSASNMNLYGEGGNSRSFFMPSLPPASAPAPAPPPPPEAQLSAPPPAVAPIGTAAPAALADVDVEDLLAAVPYSDDEEEDEDEEYDT